MFFDPEDELAITIAWQGGKNSSGTIQIPPATIRYFYQSSKELGMDNICVASPLGSYDLLLFIEHPFYLPHWLDGYFQMFAHSDERVIPTYLLAVQLNRGKKYTIPLKTENIAQMPQQLEPAVPNRPKGSGSVTALKTDKKVAQVQVGSKHGTAKKKKI